MAGISWLRIASGAVVASVAAWALAGEFGRGPMPEEGVLLLRNGEVLEGKISRVGELYYVALPSAGHQERPDHPLDGQKAALPNAWSGGEIRVKAADVELACRSLEEGYRRKRAATKPGDADAHVRLAQWCLRHGLLGHAGLELADALEADPTHPMIGLLERRLKLAVEPPPSAPARSVDQTPSLEELDHLVRRLPPGSVETFTQTIQPLLTNYCAAGGCHGPRSEGKFQLLRMPPGRPPLRRLTQRNLQAVLAWVDREDPAASRLLTVPIAPHGTAKKAVFGQAQAEQYKRMVDWVCLLSNHPAAKVPESVAPKEKPPVRAMPAELPAADRSAPKTPGGAGRRPRAGSKQEAPQKPPAQAPSVRRGGPPSAFTPVDPFDPEIFNRRYFGHSERRAESEGSD
jgi:hypothetical protein